MSEDEKGTNISGGTFNAKAMSIGDHNTIHIYGLNENTVPDPHKPLDANKTNGINLFYVYASEDEALRKGLETHLAIMRRNGLIKEWRAMNVEAGRPHTWATGFLERSQLILLLISPDLLASDVLYEEQAMRALKMQYEERARVVPILLRSTSSLEDTPLGKIVILPRNGKPVSEWHDKDKAWVEIVGEIREIIKSL